MIGRRMFLKGTVLFAGATVASRITGCASDSDGATNTGSGDATTGSDTPSSDTPSGDDLGSGPDASDDATTTIPIEPGPEWFPQSIASGDPSPESVVLWARAVNPADPAADVSITLEVSLDADLGTAVTLSGKLAAPFLASAATDHCVKARLVGLTAGTTYYYRFIVEADGHRFASRVGRTRTAPAADSDVAVRFAYVSCQDFNGRYYHAYTRLLALDPEPDFVVHLGDYVYETTADPLFQEATPDRAIAFSDKAGAIVFNAGTDKEFYAAKSLSNYRELYRQYRSDATLQAVHERWPIVAMWDDHEFTDDAWKDHGTYSDGKEDEQDEARRRNASQAWSEHMPVDFPGEPDFVYDPSKPLGEDIRVYRDFGWGKHLHVVLTDNRSYRSDHLVPEDAYPGALAATAAELTAATGSVPPDLVPFADIDTFDGGAYKAPLQAAATAAGAFPAKVTGQVSVPWVNLILGDRKAAGDTVPNDIVPTVEMALGYAWYDVGKLGHTGSLGARYFGIWERFRRLARAIYVRTAGASEDILGAEQESWLKDTIATSSRTWKAWGSSFALTTHTVDLSHKYSTIPEKFRHRWALLLEDWNGAPTRRDALIDALATTPGTVVISGDIHSFWSSVLQSESGSELIEFVGGAISSAPFRSLLISSANSDPGLKAAGAAALAVIADTLLTDPDDKPNPGVGYVRANLQGMSVVDVSADTFEVTYHLIDPDKTKVAMAAADVEAAFTTARFKTLLGGRALWMEQDGAWKRWDPTSFSWQTS